MNGSKWALRELHHMYELCVLFLVLSYFEILTFYKILSQHSYTPTYPGGKLIDKKKSKQYFGGCKKKKKKENPVSEALENTSKALSPFPEKKKVMDKISVIKEKKIIDILLDVGSNTVNGSTSKPSSINTKKINHPESSHVFDERVAVTNAVCTTCSVNAKDQVPGLLKEDDKELARNDSLKKSGRFITFPQDTYDYLNKWLSQHSACPFPSNDEKATIMADTGLSKRQVSDWFSKQRKKMKRIKAKEAEGFVDNSTLHKEYGTVGSNGGSSNSVLPGNASTFPSNLLLLSDITSSIPQVEDTVATKQQPETEAVFKIESEIHSKGNLPPVTKQNECGENKSNLSGILAQGSPEALQPIDGIGATNANGFTLKTDETKMDKIIANNGDDSNKSLKFSLFPKITVDYLNKWLAQHSENPYPSIDEKEKIMADTGLSKRQIGDWMSRARKKMKAKEVEGSAESSVLIKESCNNSQSSVLPVTERTVPSNFQLLLDVTSLSMHQVAGTSAEQQPNTSAGSKDPTQLETSSAVADHTNNGGNIDASTPIVETVYANMGSSITDITGSGQILPPSTSKTSFTNEIKEYLWRWISSPEHSSKPYPSKSEKEKIMADTGIEDQRKLEAWFSRARKKMKEQLESQQTSQPHTYSVPRPCSNDVECDCSDELSKITKPYPTSEAVDGGRSLAGPLALDKPDGANPHPGDPS